MKQNMEEINMTEVAASREKFKLPPEVADVLNRLVRHGFEAYAVGGCVRDLLLGRTPKDWDVATNATPEEIIKIFPDSFYANKFFTVTVKTGSADRALAGIEVTTYRAEAEYSDQRHPDEVRYAESLGEDLSRRDFTINAMALGADGKLIDPFQGREDLAERNLAAVGDPQKRFSEDALRLMRAARISTELRFGIAAETEAAIADNKERLGKIAKERIRDELMKMLESQFSAEGIEKLRELGLLEFVLPELEEGIGVGQNKHHIYTVWEHNLRALAWADRENYESPVKIAALLHDVGKPRAKQGDGSDSTFYQHDVIGAKMASRMLDRLHFPRQVVDKVSKLIRWHLFKYDPDEGITDSAIRRLIRRVGAENIDDLVLVRICDRMGSGVPKAVPYRLRHFQFRVEKILREEEAPTPKMLAVNGEDIMNTLGIKPGPKVGHLLAALLEEVIDEPIKNTKENLISRAKELNDLTIDELKKLAESAEFKVELIEGEQEAALKDKYHVQ